MVFLAAQGDINGPDLNGLIGCGESESVPLFLIRPFLIGFPNIYPGHACVDIG